MTSNSKFLIFIAFLLGFLYRTLAGFQGIDDLDAGFSATYCQQFFNHPEVFCTNHLRYLVGLVGGLWIHAFPQTGILGLRFLDNVAITLAIYLLYLVFRTKISDKYLAAAIFVSYLFPYIIVLLHYNTLTFLAIAASAYFFFRAQSSGYNYFYLFSGLVIGIGFFSRIVNVSLLSLLLMPIVIYYYHRDRRQLYTSLLLFLSGVVLGVSCILVLMLSLHHLDDFVNAVKNAYLTLHNPHQSHTTSNIFFVYFRDIIDILINMIGVIAIMYVYACPKVKSFSWMIVLRILSVIGLLVLSVTTATHLITITLCLMPIFCALVIFRRNSEIVITILFYTIALFSVPLGSDIGISGIFHWQAGLLIFPAAYSLQKLLTLYPIFVNKYCLRQFVCAAYFVIIVASVYRMGYKAYGEELPRMVDRSMIDVNTLNVYTDSKRAAKFQSVIYAIRTYSKSDYLIIANQMSELYFGVNKAPFLDDTCIEIFADGSLPGRLVERTSTLRSYPSIAFVSQSTYSDDIRIVRSCLMKYIHDNHYRLIVHNRNVQLYEK